MNPQWSSRLGWCGTFILMGGFVAVLASFGMPRVEKAGARSIEYLPAAPVAANSKVVETPPAPAIETVAVSKDTAKASEPSPVHPTPPVQPVVALDAASTSTSASAHAPAEPKPFVVASADPLQKILIEPAPSQASSVRVPDPLPTERKALVDSFDMLECTVAQICIDQYLWALYQRTPKQDTNKVVELRKVTVKRKGKTRIVTQRFIKLVDADFTWKDPHAAEKVGKPLKAYVIGGMDPTFRRNLLYMLLAADRAGHAPGITSAFRDDYRQSIASGQKAASNRSYHGGSLRGGYGRGLAADVVSVRGDTKEQRWLSSSALWKWIDENGKQFGIGRPYLERDAPHVAPIDGREYATHYRAPKVQVAKAGTTKRDPPTVQAASTLSDRARKVAAISEIHARRDE